MAEPFLAEIRVFSFNFAPKGWAMCDGQLLPINQNQPLFALLGTTFGGNGQTNFALPNLDGRTPMHVGNGHTLGEKGGEQNHTLTVSEMPTHTHVASASSSAGNANSAANAVLASALNVYGPATNLTAINASTIPNVGGGQAHENMQPFLTLNFSIALQGIFPSQN